MDRRLITAALAFAAWLLLPAYDLAACTGTFAANTACLGPTAGAGQGNPLAITNAYLPVISTAKGGTGANLTDPGVDRLLAWDDSANSSAWIALADIITEASPAAGDFLIGYTAEGALVKFDWDDLPAGADDQVASEVPVTPAGNIAANDVQEALEELDTEKLGATAAAGGDLSGNYPNPTVAANAVALTTDTTGNYAAGDAEAGAALTGDTATAFFSAGTVDDARVDGSAEADELVLAGDVDSTANANDLDESAVETELESVLDIPQLQGEAGSGNIAANAIQQSEVDDDAIGINELDLITGDTPVDGDCLTYDAGAGGTIEAIVCSGGTDDQTAAEVPVTPAGNIAANDVQEALEELDTEKLGATAAAGGDLSGNYPNPTVAANAVALTTDTTGNYAAGDAEAGAALTGDTATAFFSAGTVDDARIDGSAEADELVLAGDVDGAANAGDLDETAVETELEAVIDIPQLQGEAGPSNIAANAIEQSEVADDAIGSGELDFVDGDTPADEDCLTIETGGANGSLEAVACSGGAGLPSLTAEYDDRSDLAAATVDSSVARVRVLFCDEAEPTFGGRAVLRRLGAPGASGNLAGRDAHDEEAVGYIYLQTDTSPDVVHVLQVPHATTPVWRSGVDGRRFSVSNSAAVVWEFDEAIVHASQFCAEPYVLDALEVPTSKPDNSSTLQEAIEYLRDQNGGILNIDGPYAANLVVDMTAGDFHFTLMSRPGTASAGEPILTAFGPDEPAVYVLNSEGYFSTAGLALRATGDEGTGLNLSESGMKFEDVSNSKIYDLSADDFAGSAVEIVASVTGSSVNTFYNPQIEVRDAGIGLQIDSGASFVTGTSIVGGTILNHSGDWAVRVIGAAATLSVEGDAFIEGITGAVLNLADGAQVTGTGHIDSGSSTNNAVLIDGTSDSVRPLERISGTLSINGTVITGLGSTAFGQAFTAAKSAGTDTSANLRAVLSDETGTGSAVFGTAPQISAIELGHASDTTVSRPGAGRMQVEGAEVRLAGKETIPILAGAMKNDVTLPASCGDTYDSGTNDVTLTVCAFDAGANEERADFLIPLPKSYNGGTFTFRYSWTNAAGLTTETVQLEVGCVFVRDDDTWNTTLGSTVTQADTWLAQNDNHVSAESSALTCGGTWAEGASAFFRVSRDTSVDNMTGDMLLTSMRIFYTTNVANDG